MTTERKKPQRPIPVKVSEDVLEELSAEMKRTGASRAGLLKLAWREYMERRARPAHGPDWNDPIHAMNAEDHLLIAALQKKHGVSAAAVMRMALRALAERDGIKL